MKIGVSTTLVQRGRSGVGQYVIHLLRALIAQNLRDELVVFALERDAPLFAFAHDAVRLVLISDHDGSAARDLAWHHLALPRLAHEHGIDVLHVPSQRRMPWQKPCGLVTTVHDPGTFRVPRDSASRGSCPSAVFHLLARRQDGIVTLTQHAAEELTRTLGISPAQVSAVPCGVDRTLFSAGRRDEAALAVGRRYALRPPFFLHMARLEHPAQNHARIVEAFNGFKTAAPSPWQLVLIGPDGGNADLVRQLVLRSPYAQDVHCLGYMAPADMPHWYRSAGALIYAPLRWGFGLPPLEAMACGCPVVAADDGPARELCGPAAVYADHHDVKALQRALTTLASDPALRARLATAGVERAAEFNWDATAAAMLEVYARAARRAKAPVVVSSPLTTPAH